MARNNTSGWRELNDLVLSEFESLERADRSLSKEPDRPPPADAGVVFLTQRGEADTTQAPARPAADEMLAEETNLEGESAGRVHAPIFQAGEAGPGQVMELFNAEEAAFIARSVAWLQGKPSKDMILSQILGATPGIRTRRFLHDRAGATRAGGGRDAAERPPWLFPAAGTVNMAYSYTLGQPVLDRLTEVLDYAVVGPTDNRIHEIHTTRFPFNTVCHVERDFGDEVWRGCSGVLFGPRQVLTAGHCIYSPALKRGPKRIRITPGRADRVIAPYGNMIASRAYVSRRFVEAASPGHPDRKDYDYGLVVLPRAFPGLERFMPVNVASDRLLRSGAVGPMLTVAGYPGDRPTGTMWRHTEQLTR